MHAGIHIYSASTLPSYYVYTQNPFAPTKALTCPSVALHNSPPLKRFKIHLASLG